MKELLIEEKARRYDEALDNAKVVYKTIRKDLKPVIEQIFPELYEPEDERIKKQIISFLKEFEYDHYRCLDFSSWIAWLKKQGEQKPVEWHRGDEQNLNVCLGYIPDEFLKRWLKDIIHIKYDKSADKIEQKFHEGDFIKNNKANLICKVISVNSGSYYVENIETSCRAELSFAEQCFHLWNIEDAKDGDVLRLGDVIAIFKKYIGQEKCICYCSFCDNCYCSSCGKRGFEIPIENGEDNVYGCTNTTPATKEERDLLFQKMKEAGYEWNKDTKELIKQGEHKSAWSEEDEKKRTLLIKVLAVNHPNGYFKVNPANTSHMEAISTEELISWLKSL